LLLLILVGRLYNGLQLATEDVYEVGVHVLSTVIPGPNSRGWNIDVYLWPLIDELIQLWSPDALTYDISTKHNFLMRVTLMWTINDFLAYGMVFGWSTYEKLACSYCMENNKAFTLINDDKLSFFTATNGSYQQITSSARNSLLAELKGMLHRYFFRWRIV